ncbi:TIGR02594 family protein [Agrobacterium pusense]|uniref:NlpC/P60 family protein n=1 Tax=Agrobacterium pusense TaxID=648995 RepID=UPI000D199581|nr:TIGR02594 family protein [Agrobacterium pusense]
MATVREVQQRLISLGYDVGRSGADEIPGRSTAKAVTRFQEDKKLSILYPGTIGPKTLKALGLNDNKPMVPPWVTEARRFLGLHEVKSAKALDKALRLDASETAWCGAFVGMVVATALPKEPMPANPLGSRNWLKFGKPLNDPQICAIAIFWRGSKDGWQGHVGIVVGHDKTHLHILGGNQSDSVSIARIAKTRLLRYRWPITYQDAPFAAMPMTTISASVTTNEA